MWTLFLLLLPSISRCAPPFSQELKNCDDSGPRVSELSLNSALSTFLCYTEEEIGAMEVVEKKRKLAQKIAPLFLYELSYEDLVEELFKMPSYYLVKIMNEVMNNRNAENDHRTIEEYRAIFDEHIRETNVNSLTFNPNLNSDLEDLERNGRDALPSYFQSWFNFGEGDKLRGVLSNAEQWIDDTVVRLRNHMGIDTKLKGLEVSPNTAKPQILTSSQTFRAYFGDSVLLPCSVHNLGSLVPRWKHKQHVLTLGRQMVNPFVDKYQLVNDYNLQIRNIRAFDAGDYTCFITTFGQPVSLTHTIEIVGLVTDGGWSEWSVFSPCSSTCGDATKRRMRTCTQPEPANGGKYCGELNEESVSCGLQKCVTDGGWSEWGVFSPCSATCGDATKRRMRTCTQPEPANGGKYCGESNEESVSCGLQKCGDGLSKCFSAEGCPLVQNNLIMTLLELNKEFQISFEFQPTQYITGWQNVLFMTTGEKYDKKVALLVKDDGQLYPWFTAKPYLTEKKYPIGQWHSVEFSQRLEDSQYFYRVKINGVQVDEVVNNEPNIFSDVKVYASAPWHNALKGSLRNLVITMQKTKGDSLETLDEEFLRNVKKQIFL